MTISIWAVIIAAAVATILGSLWFGPLFGRQWAMSAGVQRPEDISPEERQMMKTKMWQMILLNIVGAIVGAIVIGHFFVFSVVATGVHGLLAGFLAGFGLWIGIASPILLGGVLWERKPWKWWFIMIGYYFVSFVLQGIVFAVWK